MEWELGGVAVGRICVSPVADVGVLGFFCRLTKPVQLEGKARRAGTGPLRGLTTRSHLSLVFPLPPERMDGPGPFTLLRSSHTSLEDMQSWVPLPTGVLCGHLSLEPRMTQS